MTALPRYGADRATETIVRVTPSATVVAVALALAWRERGSIAAADWLPYAVLAGLLPSIVLILGGGNRRPSHLPLTAVAAMTGLVVWTAMSAAWSPVPSLARDEAVLIALYACALAIPILSLETDRDRLAALAVVSLALAGLAVATGAALAFGDEPEVNFRGGRLYFPVTYMNAEAAISLVGVWPCIVLAAGREAPVLLRAAALGGGAALLGIWLLTQSAGAAVALGISTVVVLTLASNRLRLLVPALLAAAAVAVFARVLTEPFRAGESAALVDAVREAGRAVVALAAIGAVLGAVYALLDRRISISSRRRRLLARAVAATAAAAAVTGSAGFVVAVGDPVQYLGDRWDQVNRDYDTDATHFTSFGSQRPDMWRVAFDTFRDYPIAGVGGRGFGTVYREERRSDENPERAHSLPLDVAAETGIVGLALLTVALGALAAVAIRRRAKPWGIAAVGAGAYWLVHAAGEWIWTVPAVGIPFFVLLGITASGGGHRLGRAAVPAGVAVAAVVLVALVPPWVSARLTEQALLRRDVQGLRWAKTLDPLSVEPYLAESTLSPSPSAAIPPLREALEREPRTAALRLLLADAYRRAGRPRLARRELLEAKRLDPRSPWVRNELSRLAAKSG